MKKIIAVTFALLTLTVCGFAQTSTKNNVALETAMKKFVSSIETKNTAVFLNYISPEKGLTLMNTINQGEAGNADKPMFDSTRTHKKLAADFKKKGEYYQDIFKPSPDSPNFHDVFANRKEKWMLVADNKFQIVDAETGKPGNAFYMKWAKQGNRWYVVEVGRYIS